MDRYVQLYDESAVTCNDFIQAMADANGVDLTNFSLWWSQAGTPRVSVETNWNQDDCTFTIRASQSTPPTPGQAEKYPLVIPILVGLIGRDGKDLPLKLVGSDEEPVTTAKLVLETADDEWTFEGIAENPVLSLGRGFSAPVIFDYAYTLQELQFLALHDSDGFNRADAFERLMLAVINEVVTMIENGVEPDVHGTLISAFEGILTNTNLSPEYRATVLTLPSEKSIAAHRAMINPQAIRQARIFVMETNRPQTLAQARSAASYRKHAQHDARIPIRSEGSRQTRPEQSHARVSSRRRQRPSPVGCPRSVRTLGQPHRSSCRSAHDRQQPEPGQDRRLECRRQTLGQRAASD